jgi:hypothetical protein
VGQPLVLVLQLAKPLEPKLLNHRMSCNLLVLAMHKHHKLQPNHSSCSSCTRKS